MRLRRDRQLAKRKKLARDKSRNDNKPILDMNGCVKKVSGWDHYLNINNVKVRMGTAYRNGLFNYIPSNIDSFLGKDKAVKKKDEDKIIDFNSVGFKLMQTKAKTK